MELELQAARTGADIADRAKSIFMANMSHELRTPLNAVIGYSEMIEAEIFGAAGSPKYREYAGDIASAGRHLLDLVNDVLDFTQMESGLVGLREDRVTPGDLIREAARMAPRAARSAGPVLDVGRIAPEVTIGVDRRLMRQALVNLLGNARKFSSPEAEVRIGSEVLADGQLCFYVSDTGRGIAAADLPLALAPFGRIEASVSAGTQGAGLGLPITRAIVEGHGGDLFVNSQKGVGTTVFLALPEDRVACADGTRPAASIAGLKDYFRFGGRAVTDTDAALGNGLEDDLPFGAILLDPTGQILRYNAVEARFSEMRPDRVTGRNFFSEVAPCTFTDRFHGRFRDVSEGRLASVLFSFVFTLRRPWKVLVEMRPGADPGTVWLFVRWV